jgi:putative ABC transport system permease protein
MNFMAIAWRNIGRNGRRTMLSVLAITLATAAIVVLFSFLEGMKDDMASNLIEFYTGEVRVRDGEYARYDYLSPLHLSLPADEGTLDALDALAETQSVVPRLTVPGAVFAGERRLGVQVVGVDFEREQTYSEIGEYVAAGDAEGVFSWRAPESPDGPVIVPVVAGSRVPERLGVEIGEQFTVVARTAWRGTNAMTFRVVAVADFPVGALNETAVWAPIERVQRLAQMPDRTTEFLIKVTPNVDAEVAVGAVETVIGSAVASGGASDSPPEVLHWTEIETSYSFVRMAETVYTFIALFFFLLASTVIINTTMMVIFERKREIGTLAAMGMRPGEVVRLFFAESVIVGTIGAAAGTILGLGIAYLLSRTGINLGEMMQGVDFEISTVMYPVINARSSVVVFFFSIAVTAATSFLPTRRITRMEPVAALRDE